LSRVYYKDREVAGAFYETDNQYGTDEEEFDAASLLRSMSFMVPMM
jgi:hypothetical protein